MIAGTWSINTAQESIGSNFLGTSTHSVAAYGSMIDRFQISQFICISKTFQKHHSLVREIRHSSGELIPGTSEGQLHGEAGLTWEKHQDEHSLGVPGAKNTKPQGYIFKPHRMGGANQFLIGLFLFP